jgi:(p)ppGpp synthase/HD superfamily hydrolase
MDRVGLLRDVTSVVSGENVNIASCVSEEYDNVSIITLTLHVSGINQLSRLFFKLESVKGVMNVTRSNL